MKKDLFTQHHYHLCHYLCLQNQTPQTQTPPSLQPYQWPTLLSHKVPLHPQEPVFYHWHTLVWHPEDLVHLPP